MTVELTKNWTPTHVLWADGYLPWTYAPHTHIDAWYLPGHITPSHAVALMHQHGVGAIYGGIEHVWIMPTPHTADCWQEHLYDVATNWTKPIDPARRYDGDGYCSWESPCGWGHDQVDPDTPGAIPVTLLHDGHDPGQDIPKIHPTPPIPGQEVLPI